MIVVMPTGHTKPFRFGGPAADRDEFIEDFLNHIKPYIENNFRVKLGSENTAIAGLSMGGGHTINISIPHLSDYGYIGVFSSGVFGIEGGNAFLPNMGGSWEERNLKTLDDPELKKGLKLVWFATGKDDFLLSTTKATVAVLRKHNFDVVFNETNGGHIWKNWREYLLEFSQKLFK
jgi:enterochelin esterase family protein